MHDHAPSPLPPFVINAALLLGTITLGIAGIEVFLQRYRPVASAVYRTDDRVLYRLIPGGRRVFMPIPANGANVLVQVDQRGFRGDGFSDPRRGPRVVVYGDSFVEAEYSPLHETFVSRLQDELRRVLGEGGLETVNAGVSAYGPDQAALRIEDEIGDLSPDLLVLCVFTGNDFGDLVRNRLFRLDPAGEAVQNHPVLGPRAKKSFEDAQQGARRPAIVRAAQVAWERMRAPAPKTTFPDYVDDSLALRKKEYAEFASPSIETMETLLWDGYDADIAVEPGSPSAQLKAALMTGVLARIDRTARAHGVPWLLVVIPDPIDVAAADFELQVDEAKYPQYDPRRLSATVVAAAESLGIPYVDLYDTLTETPGERLFFRYGDNHWNAAGQAKAAAQVASALAERPMPLRGPRLAVVR